MEKVNVFESITDEEIERAVENIRVDGPLYQWELSTWEIARRDAGLDREDIYMPEIDATELFD